MKQRKRRRKDELIRKSSEKDRPVPLTHLDTRDKQKKSKQKGQRHEKKMGCHQPTHQQGQRGATLTGNIKKRTHGDWTHFFLLFSSFSCFFLFFFREGEGAGGFLLYLLVSGGGGGAGLRFVSLLFVLCCCCCYCFRGSMVTSID